MGWKVPDVLLSGHAAEIDKWRHEQSLERTEKLRPDLASDDGETGTGKTPE
jgi:tRNA (guanine37-N1)-methyltransferase